MKQQELISVIIPTHGRCDTLERALKSVQNQTYSNIEIIVVDDNSDNKKIRKVVQEIVTKYDVNLVKNSEQLGGGETRNNGIRHARGKYVVFLDDDDEMYPTRIEKQYKLYKNLNDDKVGMIYCYAEYVFPEKTMVRKVDYEGIPLKEHLEVCIAATSWWFCPKEVLQKIGGFVNFSSHQDAITLFNMLKAGYRIYRVPEVLLKYYVPDGHGITKTSNEWIDVDRAYMKLYLEVKNKFTEKENKNIQYSFYKRMASYDFILGNKIKLYHETINMLLRYPFRLPTLKAVLKCFLVIFRRSKDNVK